MDWYFIFLAVVPSFFLFPFFPLPLPPSSPSPLPPSFSVVLTKSHSLHVLRHNDRAFCLSAEISQWFWDSDLLQSMLRQVHLLVAVVSTSWWLWYPHTHRYTSWWLWYPHTHVGTNMHSYMSPHPLPPHMFTGAEASVGTVGSREEGSTAFPVSKENACLSVCPLPA